MLAFVALLPAAISDADNDLNVTLRVFLFSESFIAEFKIKNNLPSTILENVRVELKHSG